METCKYGSGAGKRKPTAVKRKGVVCRAYMFDKKTDCEFLEDGIIGKNDRKRVIYNLIKSLQCKLGQ